MVSGLARMRKTASVYVTDPIVSALARTPITPDIITWIGFFITVGAAVLIALDYLIAAGAVVLFAAFFDMLDGALARRTDRVTVFGGVLDSTLDRLSEGMLFLGVLALFSLRGSDFPALLRPGPHVDIGIMLVGIVLISSMLVSYIRARVEATGLTCTVGIFTRPERIIVLALGLFINQIEIALGIIAALSLFTAGQRLYCVWRQTKQKGSGG
jgi:CDP-diacylglycerol--glycerol-3-phosphate 3-phosphatidyltransferase